MIQSVNILSLPFSYFYSRHISSQSEDHSVELVGWGVTADNVKYWIIRNSLGNLLERRRWVAYLLIDLVFFLSFFLSFLQLALVKYIPAFELWKTMETPGWNDEAYNGEEWCDCFHGTLTNCPCFSNDLFLIGLDAYCARRWQSLCWGKIHTYVYIYIHRTYTCPCFISALAYNPASNSPFFLSHLFFLSLPFSLLSLFGWYIVALWLGCLGWRDAWPPLPKGEPSCKLIWACIKLAAICWTTFIILWRPDAGKELKTK